MGNYKTTNTTGASDVLFGIRTSKAEDRRTGEAGRGAGFTQDEADKSAFSHLKGADPNDSRYEGGDSGEGSGGSSGGDSGGSCCYVTTACLDALGLPRDSLEMRAMKTLTREHILKSFSGKRDYVLYGRKGPLIVQAIGAREDSQGIWKRIYEKLQDVTSSVLSSNYERGHQLYKELILGLEAQFV
ncbi:MAG: hypothetical protein KKE50_04800 [Nanoarchaeota archaeon]|nr:hypothetical protein [Nanoarchaeota archaeon]